MLTPFGKTIRKHRIDATMTLREMAGALDISPAFLSAVETGRKPIPESFIDRIAALLNLDIAARAELKSAADASATAMRMQFGQDASARDREVATLFARQFGELTDADKEAIRHILEGGRR